VGELDGDIRLRSVVLGPGGVQGHVDARSTAQFIYIYCERWVIPHSSVQLIWQAIFPTLKKFPIKKDILFLAIAGLSAGCFEEPLNTNAIERDHVHQ